MAGQQQQGRVRVMVILVAASVMLGLWFFSPNSRQKPESHPEIEDVEAEEESAEKTASADGEKSEEELAAARKKKAKEEIKKEFNAVKQKAFELFKSSPPSYEGAATYFTKAIELAEKHDSLASQRVALYNNRSACRERINDLEAALEDCAVVLASNKMHAKVRRRRARIYEQLGRHDDALVEICADLLIQREDYKKAAQSPDGKQPQVPVPVDSVETVMRAVGKEAAAEVLRNRDENFDFGMPSSNTCTQLLLTYANYDERYERAARELKDSKLAKMIESAENDKEKMELLLRRATKFTYSKRYDEAKADVDAALALGVEDSGAELWRQVGLFRHLSHRLDDAVSAYQRALTTETDGKLRSETYVKLAGVHVDSGDLDSADKELEKAKEEDPSSSDVYMHRAQLHVIRRDLVAAQKDLEDCVEAAPSHVLARLRLATVLIHNSASEAAIDRQIEEAEKIAPNMSEVYQVKGEILLAKRDLQSAIAEFDKAISLDKHNPVPLYNKGLALIQINQFDTQRTLQLFEAALKVDPTCMVALMRLSELKLQLAVAFQEAQEVVDMLGNAFAFCRDKDELVELATVRGMAIGQLAAAKQVGLTSFQM